MVLSLTVLCTLFEFGMSLSDEWQFCSKFVIFIKGTNKSLPSSESLFTTLMTGSALFLFFIVVGQGLSSHPFFYYLTSLQQSFSYIKNPTATYSFIGSLSSNGPTFSKYSNMLICSTCRFRQLATNMSCSVMQEISLSSMLMITVEIA